MLGLLEHSPDIFLDEIQDQLEEQNGVVVSLATICRTLRRLGVTSKKVSSSLINSTSLTKSFRDSKLSKVAQERCKHARRDFTIAIGDEPPERLVTADEAAVNILTSYRENGWAPRGLRARKRAKFVRGTRYVPQFSVFHITC